MGNIKKDSLGDRMKSYESVNDRLLVPKMPFIIRVDGKAFHTYTRGLAKPFDSIMSDTMIKTTKELCSEIPGAVIAYTQSDEITIVCNYTDRIKTQSWFNGRVQKIETIAAAKATKWFNYYFTGAVGRYDESKNPAVSSSTLLRKVGMAEFDARVFNIPEWDCINNIIWRQQDAIRNSIEAVSNANFTAKEVHKLNCYRLKEKLYRDKGIDWEKDFNSYQKYGAFCYKVEVKKGDAIRHEWHCDINDKFIVQDERERFSELTGLSEV